MTNVLNLQRLDTTADTELISSYSVFCKVETRA